MNKFYRLVWSRARAALVIASEFARSSAVTVSFPIAPSEVGALHLSRLAARVALLSLPISAIAGTLDGGTIRNANTTSVAIGFRSVVDGNGIVATAVGVNQEATGNFANAYGTFSKATANKAVSFGHGNTASGAASAAIGSDSVASGAGSVTLGTRARATEGNAVAAGSDAEASAESSIAVGRGARASHAGSVALGSGATTEAAVATQSVSIAGQVYQFAGSSLGSTVSIGAAGSERTITNVAAGRISSASTDAVMEVN